MEVRVTSLRSNLTPSRDGITLVRSGQISLEDVHLPVGGGFIKDRDVL